METILQVNAVKKHYGPVRVLRQCSLEIQAGEIYGLLGINGAGKTTLMKLVLGLQKLDGGSILVLGREIRDSPAYLAQVGSIIETPSFYEHLTAQALLTMHLAYLGREGDIAGTLQRVGLGGETRPIGQFSLGMKQRLGLARAILHRPRLLLLDEPLNGLDPVAILEMRTLLGELAGEGMAILLSSHIIGELRHSAGRIGVLSGGVICQEFSTAEKIVEYGDGFEDYVVGLMRGRQHEVL
ncbi:MAG: ATP-binding cassette domain-containing protein [Ruminiclostridium sp.]|nr:ATP-binding cassette domain-containing protein [Ruminiclostridium sp.]